MIQIYHNPRCSKSRQGLALLEESQKEFEILRYLENPPTVAELTEIIQLLKIPAENLIRKKEQIWKEKYKGKELTEPEILAAMSTYPQLIERPIVINGKKAVVGRPTELIKTLI